MSCQYLSLSRTTCHAHRKGHYKLKNAILNRLNRLNRFFHNKRNLDQVELTNQTQCGYRLKKQLAPRMYALQTGSRYFFEQGNIKVEGSEIFAVSTDPSARAILNDFSSIFDRLHDDSVVPYAALLKEASPSTTDPAPVATKAVGAGPSQDVAGPSSSHSQPQSTAAATGAPSPALRDKLDETACQDSEMCNVDSTADDAAENGPKSSAVAVADAGGQQSDVGGWCAQHVMCLMMVWNSFDVPRGTVDELVGGALQLGRLVKPPCDGVTVTEEELVLHRGYEVAREEYASLATVMCGALHVREFSRNCSDIALMTED